MRSSRCGEWHILGVVDGAVLCVDCLTHFCGIELSHPLQILRVVTDDAE